MPKKLGRIAIPIPLGTFVVKVETKPKTETKVEPKKEEPPPVKIIIGGLSGMKIPKMTPEEAEKYRQGMEM